MQKGNIRRIFLMRIYRIPEGSGIQLRIFSPTKTKAMKSGVCSDRNQPSIFNEYYANVVQYLKQKSFPMIDFVWRMVMTSRTERVFEMKYICRGFVLKDLKDLR